MGLWLSGECKNMIKVPLIHYLIAFCLLFTFSSCAYADLDRLSLIKARGKVIIGVKNDYQPWAYIDINNQLAGFEIDLAQLIAKKLGVELQLAVVNSSNRIAKLLNGEIDIILATMGDTSARREQVGIIDPGYFASGVNFLTARKDIKQWENLYGRSICLIKDAFYNRELIQRFLFDPVEFKGRDEVLQAMRNGVCDGWLYDDTALIRILDDAHYKTYRLAFDSIMIAPWAIAVKPEERLLPLGKTLQSLLIDWHRQGTLILYEKQHGLPGSKYLLTLQERWNSDQCADPDEDGRYPYLCQGHYYPLTGKQNSHLIFGLDIPMVYDSYSRQQLLKAVGITVALSFFSILGSLTFGFMLAFILVKSPRWLVVPFWLVVYLFRMIPPILNLYIVYFGIGGIIASQFGITLDAFLVATLILSLYAGTSNAVMLRHAYQRCGEYKLTIIRSYQNLMSNSVNIVKASGIASTIALAEIISVTKSIVVEFGQSMLMMTCLLVFYYLLVSCVIFLLNRTRSWVVKWK